MGLVFLVWLTCFALSVEDALRQTAYDPVLVVPAAGTGYPRFVAAKSGVAQPELALAPGDEILSVGGTSLRGAGVTAWIAAFARHHGPDVRLEVTYRTEGDPRRTKLAAGSYRAFWPRHLASLAFVGCALFLAFWARPSPLVDAIVWTDLVAAVFFSCTFAGGVVESGAAVAVHVASLGLAAPLALRASLLFPHGVPPASRLARFGPWAFASLALFDVSRFYGTPLSHAAGAAGSAAVGLLYVAIGAAVSARTYLRSDALARRRLRWMILAGYLVAVPFVLAVALTAWDPGYGKLLAVAISAFGIVPIAVTIALVRANLFDVDQLLGSAASYTVVLVAVLAGALWAVPALADGLRATAGVESGIAQVVLAFGLALALVRLHGWLRPGIDRVFFAERYAFEHGMHALMNELSRCADAAELAATAGRRVVDGLRLASGVVYLEAGEALTPAFVCGRDATALPRDGALVATLTHGSRVLAEDAGALDPFERAVLESLDVPLVLPIWVEGRLGGALALGHKRSGDVFTTTERALLAAVADKIASELTRFASEQRLAASDRERVALGEYVAPGIADRLRRGEAVDLGEREVAILFTDLRDYTAWAERRPLDELHAALDRYAATVAAVVHEHGGSVVDFAGDGLMAVFGAPEELDGKERAAVEAARRIVEEVRALPVPPPGVGVATGVAWVGTVRAGAQLHWSALGDTTNLASRLQGLTRELDAWLCVDEATWQRAKDARHGLEPRDATAIRGRTGVARVWVLPISREARRSS